MTTEHLIAWLVSTPYVAMTGGLVIIVFARALYKATLNRQAILDSSPKPIPTVFADAKGYADSGGCGFESRQCRP